MLPGAQNLTAESSTTWAKVEDGLHPVQTVWQSGRTLVQETKGPGFESATCQHILC